MRGVSSGELVSSDDSSSPSGSSGIGDKDLFRYDDSDGETCRISCESEDNVMGASSCDSSTSSMTMYSSFVSSVSLMTMNSSVCSSVVFCPVFLRFSRNLTLDLRFGVSSRLLRFPDARLLVRGEEGLCWSVLTLSACDDSSTSDSCVVERLEARLVYSGVLERPENSGVGERLEGPGFG